MGEAIYNNFFGIPTYMLVLVPFLIVILIIYGPYLVSKKWAPNEYINPQRITSSIWFGTIVFILLVDGHFIESGIAEKIIYIGGGINIIHLVFNHLKDITKLRITKGNMGIEIESDKTKVEKGGKKK